MDTLVFIIINETPGVDDELNILIQKTAYKRKISTFKSNILFKIDYRNSEDDRRILDKILSCTITLGEIASVKAGLIIYEKGKGEPPQTKETLENKPFTTIGNKPNGWQKLYRGKHVDRYRLLKTNEFIAYGPWLAAPRNSKIFEKLKILMRRTDDRIKACIENEESVAVKSCHVISLKDELNTGANHLYLLGILNSKLIQHMFEIQNPQMVNKVFAEIKVVYVENLPITSLDFTNKKDKARHDRMVSLVESMLDLHKQLAEARTPQAKKVLQRRIETTDRQIDKLVYELYGLTKEEIKIVESGIGR